VNEQGCPIQAVMRRRSGKWEIVMHGPLWMLDELIDELYGRALVVASFGFNSNDDQNRTVALTQVPREDLCEH